jgi:hypothetical protein
MEVMSLLRGSYCPSPRRRTTWSNAGAGRRPKKNTKPPFVGAIPLRYCLRGTLLNQAPNST